MSNDAIGGRILNIGNRKMSNDAIGGRILNIGHANKLQTRKDELLHVMMKK